MVTKHNWAIFIKRISKIYCTMAKRLSRLDEEILKRMYIEAAMTDSQIQKEFKIKTKKKLYLTDLQALVEKKGWSNLREDFLERASTSYLQTIRKTEEQEINIRKSVLDVFEKKLQDPDYAPSTRDALEIMKMHDVKRGGVTDRTEVRGEITGILKTLSERYSKAQKD